MVKKEFKDVSMTNIVRDWVTCVLISSSMKQTPVVDWVPPCVGKLKANFDGASFGNSGPVGYGCLVRDHLISIISVEGG